MKLAFFSGCVIPVKYPGVEAATRFLADELGIELVSPKFGCCPAPTGLKGIHFDSWLTLATRNLCLAEEEGLDIVTICSGCTNTLREAGHFISEDEKKRDFVQGVLEKHGKSLKGEVKVVNLADLLSGDDFLDLLEDKLVRPLQGMKFGTHYGCHYFRPGAVMQDDDPDPRFPLPESMELILESLGAEIVPYSRQDLCCGAALSINNEMQDESFLVTKEKLGWMNEAELDALAVPCPACFNQFDVGQALLSRKNEIDRTIPVYHIAEVVAYALGADTQLLNLKSHRVPVTLS